jgi:DNA-binding response OmpR family regulator
MEEMPKILAVDDNIPILDFYRDFFTEAGFEIQTADDAFSAITRHLQFKSDLIILDLDIPAGGGLMVFERLRNRFWDPVPVIFVTGKPEKLPRLDNIHNVSALTKPVDPDRLLAEVKKMLAGGSDKPPCAGPASPETVRTKILAVEDNPAILDFYRELFSEAGFEIQTAEDAFSAITRHQQFKSGLIILDLDIPAGGGMCVFERLRSHLLDPVPIIFVTGKPEKLPRLDNLHNVSALTKPVDPDRLLAEVKRMLTEDPRRETPPPPEV